MITVRTKSSSNVKEVVRFLNRNFPEAVLKVSVHFGVRLTSWKKLKFCTKCFMVSPLILTNITECAVS